MILIPFHNWYQSACEGKTSVKPLSLQSCWRPTLGERRKWSNILATPSDTHPPNNKCEPASRVQSHPANAGQFLMIAQ